MSESEAPLRVAVIGGGFTGAAFAIHAMRGSRRKLAFTVVEPATELAKGTAYGTDDRTHRINVPSDRMALSTRDPTEATRWFFHHGVLPDQGSDNGSGHFYVPRQAYGAFALDTLNRTREGAGDRVAWRHVQARARRVERDGEAWRVETDDAASFGADLVALCFGHAAPAHPCPIDPEVLASLKLVPDPWARHALARVDASDSVLIVGTGLTMADVVTSLKANRHRAPITAISRRGLMPRGHGLFLTDVDLFERGPPPRTALGLLRHLRRRIREAGAEIGWQPFADALRVSLPDVWNGLALGEQRRVVRWLLPFWDVHRFRISPQAGAVIQAAQDDGSLMVRKAGLIALRREGGRHMATLRYPGGRTPSRSFDAVILCTGPEKNLRKDPLTAHLLESGTARPDNTGLGLAVDRTSRVLDRSGRPAAGLLALGPMTRGSFGEMTGAPDIAKHIEQIVGPVLEAFPIVHM